MILLSFPLDVNHPMLLAHKHATDQDRREARRISSLKYDHSDRGRKVRRKHICSKRKIAKQHISRLALPDILEDWACAALRQTYEVYKAALHLDGNFQETEFSHWISSPPFDASAIALANEPEDSDYQDWLACLVDGCLLRREQAFEASLKDHLEHMSKKQMVDHLRTHVKTLLTQDWVDMRGKEGLYKPGTREHTVYERHRDCELPRGQIRSFVNAMTAKHWQITLAGRIVAVVQEREERYLVLEALPGDQMMQDFQEMVWALGRLKDRSMQNMNTKSENSWIRPGRDGFDSGYVYVHITSKTKLTTHAWERDESWLVEPATIPVPMDPIAVGAAVFCVAHLLQIDNQLHDEPALFTKVRFRLLYSSSSHSTQQWVLKCRFLSRLHRPAGPAQARHPGMLVFLSRGGIPGGAPVSASQATR
ncbi:hypothetical protein C8F01DRAFT_1081515 [Mycena amicta]|nr:hypothetical protein C8F01DRAFT_1081515 [Mycena amicta]